MIGDFIGDEPSHKIIKQVLEDTNNDYGSDVEIGGATVQLKDPNGTVVMPTMTDCNGNFTLNASPGMYRYTIVKQKPPGFLNVGNSTISVNTSSANVLNIFFDDQHPISAPSVSGCLYRYFLLGSISRSVKEDTDNNDSEDTNLVGVTVALQGPSGNSPILHATVTNFNGDFVFVNLPNGNYFVKKIIIPALAPLHLPCDPTWSTSMNSSPSF